MATTFTSGNSGSVLLGGSAIAGITSWKLDITTAAVPIPTFTSTVDADGRVFPNVLAGLSGGTGTAEGYFNSDPADASDSSSGGITTGANYTLDLVIDKDGGPWGYSVSAFITSQGAGSNINNQPNPFTIAFTVNGVVPRSGSV